MSRGTAHRSIRMDDTLYHAVVARAADEDTTVSEVVRGLLRTWLDTPKTPPPG
jgi:hypothetical protein